MLVRMYFRTYVCSCVRGMANLMSLKDAFKNRFSVSLSQS